MNNPPFIIVLQILKIILKVENIIEIKILKIKQNKTLDINASIGDLFKMLAKLH